jgi:predicted AlkP superfamily pyrophosphatase or phosphodiesterase
MARFGSVIFGLFALLLCGSVQARQTVLLVSIDGFRADYLTRGLTPTLSALAERGVQAAMRPSFPSLTFPNHYTLVTGRYPDHHGIVDNIMNDPALAHPHFTLSDREAVTDRAWWDEATPLWVSVQRQGGHAATMFWPGSEVDIQGVRPDHWLPYDQQMADGDRVGQVLTWLDLPEAERPSFLTLYFDKVDTAGHHEGPDSDAVNQALRDVDGSIAQLVEGLNQRGLADKVDLIIVADHGMAPIARERTVFIDDVVPAEEINVVTSGAMMGLSAVAGAESQVEQALFKPQAHMTCSKKQDLPARLHYGSNSRIPPILCLAEIGWQINTHAAAEKRHGSYNGTHGFDNQAPEMAALFIAHGPDFRPGLKHAGFDNVDVYPLMAKLLGVTPETNDGKLADVADMLRR